MASFQEAIVHCGLSDLPRSGLRFTWSNNRRGATFTKERIDRVMVNQARMVLLPGSSYLVMPAIRSDHSPLVISFVKPQIPVVGRPYIFRYEACWELRSDYSKILQDSWDVTYPHCQRGEAIIDKLTQCKQDLIQWRKILNLHENVGKWQQLQQIGHVQSKGIGSHIDIEHQFQEEMQLKLEKEELRWK